MQPTVEHFEYLDDLRASGEINMFGAPAYLQDEFELSAADARAITSAWMKTFDADKSPQARVAEAMA